MHKPVFGTEWHGLAYLLPRFCRPSPHLRWLAIPLGDPNDGQTNPSGSQYRARKGLSTMQLVRANAPKPRSCLPSRYAVLCEH